MKLSINILLALLTVCCLTFISCSSDDPATIPSPQTFSGNITSSIPQMDFTAEPSVVQSTITWTNVEQTKCDIKVGGFGVTVPQMNMSIEIGDMLIKGIDCVKAGNDSFTFSAKEFNCMAGKYDTTGDLEGSLKNGILTLTLIYKPGSMPFDVKSVFISTK